MDFRLSEEQNMMVEMACKLGEQYGLDYWRDIDSRKAYPVEMWQAICDAGICGIALPEEYGGSGRGMLEVALVVEALCGAGAGATLAQVMMVNMIFGGVSIHRFGTGAQRNSLLPGIISGDVQCCMALTEPDAGSNTPEMRTFASRDGDGWRLNGQKIWISGVPTAQKMLVVARTIKREQVESRTHGINLFMIDTDRPGLSHTALDKMGTHTVPSSMVYFDNVRVEPDELLGDLDDGWQQLLDVLNTERIVTTAGLIGTGTLAIKLGVNYANQRKVFSGKPVGSYQGIQFPLAQAHAELECARLMNWRAAVNFDNGLPYGSEANTAKLIAAQAASRAVDIALQTMGGMGYSKEMHVERLYRDTRLFRIAPIAEEMILNFIAQHDLGMPRSY